MKKTTGRVTWCCAALLLTLTSVSAVQRLNSIDDLKKITFGQSVPTHSLVLLYWFANTVNIGYNGVIELTFDPNNGDYGSHYYSNYERLLDQLPQGRRYYTVGNLKQETSRRLPSYVNDPPYLTEARNRDRIIIRVNGQRIDQVYITQHNDFLGTNYDPDHTYHITTNLLNQIRQFSLGGNNQTMSVLRNRFGSNADVSHFRNTWGDLACLVLFLSIVTTTTTTYYFNEQSSRLQNRQSYESTWNRGAGSYNNSAPQDDDLWTICRNLCRWLGYFVVFVFFIIILLMAFSGKLAHV